MYRFIILLLLPFLSGCSGSVPDEEFEDTPIEKPTFEELSGTYLPSPGVNKLLKRFSAIQPTQSSFKLKPDKVLIVNNMPDLWNKDGTYPNQILKHAKGTWTIGGEKSEWHVYLTLPFEDGMRQSTIQLCIKPKKPPYHFWIYLGDPDSEKILEYKRAE